MNWIQTYTGRKVEVLDLKPADICIEDIAHALSNICRFTGHCKSFWSVSQHSLLVSHYCDTQDALWGLLHDGSEAYLCDIPRPLKRLDIFKPYRDLESDIMDSICVRFGLPSNMPDSVRKADDVLLATEKKQLMHNGRELHDWDLPEKPLDDLLLFPVDPTKAKELFLRRFYNLYQV